MRIYFPTDKMEENNTVEKLTLPQAQEEFLSILGKLNDEQNLQKLLSWIQWNWLNTCEPPKKIDLPEDVLKAIADDIRCNLPPDAVLPSETIRTPTIGQNSDCDPKHTLHVDAFLYDDEMVDSLSDSGQLDRNYCIMCGSHKTKPLTFISHSASRERIAYIFNSLLPPIEGKLVLDIGSRLGAVLYGAFLYTKAGKIVGIEMNSDFCKLQREIIKKYGFQDRIEVIEDNVINRPDVVQAADVVILNNAFDFFMDTEHQAAVWSFLRQTIKKGAILITAPALEETFTTLPTNINLDQWVRTIPAYNPDPPGLFDASSEADSVKQYHVL